MAKKQSEAKEATGGAKPAKAAKPAAKKPAAKASAAKAPAKSAKTGKPAKAATGRGDMPMVDTGLAAQAAARMLSAGFGGKSAAPSTGKEGSLIKQLKADLKKPASAGLDNLLDKTGGANQKRPNLPFGNAGASKQVGHNQTFGADVNRVNVPRRTGG